MSEYNFVQIGSLYLTDDQTDTGEPCRVDIPQLTKFRMDKHRTIVTTIEGSLHVQLFAQLGETLQMLITLMRPTNYEALLPLLNNSQATKTPVNIKISAVIGNFDSANSKTQLSMYVLEHDGDVLFSGANIIGMSMGDIPLSDSKALARRIIVKSKRNPRRQSREVPGYRREIRKVRSS